MNWAILRTGCWRWGFCAPGTLGARVVGCGGGSGDLGDTIPGKSPHYADGVLARMPIGPRLVRYLSCQDPKKVKEVFLVHGVDHGLRV